MKTKLSLYLLKFISLNALKRVSEDVEFIKEKLDVANSKKAVIDPKASSGYLREELR
jgi:hypothetical protein